jgi:hypothetical protein
VGKLLAFATLVVGLAVIYLFGPTLMRSFAPESATATQPATKPAAGDVQVEVTENALTDRLNQRLAGQSLGSTPIGAATFQTLEARLRSGKMQVDGSAQVAGRDVPLTMSSTVEVESGRPVVSVDDARAAGVPLVEPARQSLEDALQQHVDSEVQRLGVQVKSVSIADGKMVLTGSRGP